MPQKGARIRTNGRPWTFSKEVVEELRRGKPAATGPKLAVALGHCNGSCARCGNSCGLGFTEGPDAAPWDPAVCVSSHPFSKGDLTQAVYGCHGRLPSPSRPFRRSGRVAVIRLPATRFFDRPDLPGDHAICTRFPQLTSASLDLAGPLGNPGCGANPARTVKGVSPTLWCFPWRDIQIYAPVDRARRQPAAETPLRCVYAANPLRA